jgi:hypothetical protein
MKALFSITLSVWASAISLIAQGGEATPPVDISRG